MLSTETIGRLIEPVISRATASAVYPRLGWRDRWAEMVLEKLDVAPELMRSFRASSEQQFDGLQRCKWIDDQLLTFLRRYPNAQVVELNAGLSTRFHRISNACDWPRFSWVAVDTMDVTEVVSYVFPKLDHHARVTFDGIGVNWLDSMPWRTGAALMIIDDGGLVTDRQTTQTLLQKLLRIAERHTPVHLLITQKILNIQALINISGRPLNLLTHSNESEDGLPLIPRLLLRLKNRFSSRRHLRVAHFEINPLPGYEVAGQ